MDFGLLLDRFWDRLLIDLRYLLFEKVDSYTVLRGHLDIRAGGVHFFKNCKNSDLGLQMRGRSASRPLKTLILSTNPKIEMSTLSVFSWVDLHTSQSFARFYVLFSYWAHF